MGGAAIANELEKKIQAQILTAPHEMGVTLALLDHQHR